MAEFCLPSPTYNSRGVSDIELEQLLHPVAGDGLVGDPSDAALVYADGSGMTVKLRSDRFALVRGRLYGTGTSDVTKVITDNSSGLTRIDLVVLRLTRATAAITSVVKAGTPGAGAPTVTTDLGTTGVYEIPLATVNVPTGDTAIGSTQVTPLAWYLGDQIIVCTSTTRPAHQAGRIIWETDTSQQYVSTGAAWRKDGTVICTSSTRPAHQAGLWIRETDTGRIYMSTGSAWQIVHTYVCTSTTRPSHAAGLLIWETDTSRAYMSTGSAWRIAVDEAGAVALTSAAGWSATGSTTRRRNGMATVNLRGITRIAAGSTLEGSLMATIPDGFRPIDTYDVALAVHGTAGIRDLVAQVQPNGTITSTIHDAIYQNDRVYGSLTYPVAY